MIDRDGAPMFHIEHFVEGKYVKYNSNTGFVLKEDETVRSTPQVHNSVNWVINAWLAFFIFYSAFAVVESS